MFSRSVPSLLLPDAFASMTSLHRRYTTLILDLGDVLFTWSAETKTAISPKLLHQILPRRGPA